MILKKNYNGETTLKDWWRIVRENFGILAENAVSKEELNESVSGAITQYVSEDMAALEEVRKTLTDNAEVIDVLNSSIAGINAHKADKLNPHGVTAAQVGLGNLLNEKQATKEEFDELNAVKTEIVCGTYNFEDLSAYYNGEKRCTEIFIDLGFTPQMVEICRFDGVSCANIGDSISSYVMISGGTAMTGEPCTVTHYGHLEGGASSDSNAVTINHIEIADGGFYIRDFLVKDSSGNGWKLSNRSGVSYLRHFFKAYKNIGIAITGDEE